uniref:Uncharacterized protein n=1 Tax=Anguilla anguilla TaxID=7936 RepID=A0A0E9UGY5_ANGAN
MCKFKKMFKRHYIREIQKYGVTIN